MTDTAMRWASAGERAYARKLVRNILSRGWHIGVHDGEERTVHHSRKESEILDALATTEMDELLVTDASGKRVGWFMLIWGNDPDGSELVADCSANDLCESICAEVFGAQE